jgi:hypothetical protein
MANPHKGEIAFEAEGRSYVLRFSIDAICQLEAETNRGIVSLIGELQDPEKMSLTMVRRILWAGLQEHQPDLSLKDAGELIPAAGGMANLLVMFGKAFSASFPALKEDGPRPRKAGGPRNGIGPHSTGSGAALVETTKASGARHHGK